MTVKKVKERGEKHYVRRHYVGRRRSNPNFDPDEHNFMVVTSSGMDLGTSIVNTHTLFVNHDNCSTLRSFFCCRMGECGDIKNGRLVEEEDN